MGDRPHDLATGLSAGIVDRRDLGDHRTQAQLVSELAQLYGDLGNFTAAIELTHNAIALANQAQAMDIAAIYHHHLGRWLIQAHRPMEALDAYRQAIGQFRSFRQAYALSDSNTQLSFQTTVEPIYREAIGLLLQPQASQDANPRSTGSTRSAASGRDRQLFSRQLFNQSPDRGRQY
ncbi:MAG: hypothetical protein HC795_01855 [Coleofasciculaceae cyanobacterium RL_1_1]|nr:hypothetical protein [Coleofasciculaceae cyanobacterium RL_1_1]